MGATFPFSLLHFAIFKVLPSGRAENRSDGFETVLFGADPRSGQPWSIAEASHKRHERGITLLCQTGSSLRSLLFREASVLGNKGGEGVPRRPIWIGAPRRSQREGTYVNRRHSKGIKEALHRFVLEAVLLICPPTNECIGPVFPFVWTMALQACINWMYVTPTQWHALGRVLVISSLNLPH